MSIATLSRTASRSTSGFLIAAFLATASPHARADEARLAWDNCVADGGTTNAEFACDTNSGFHFVVASFVLDGTVTTANTWGLEGEIHVGSIGTTSHLDSDWWLLSSDGCRPGALVSSADFTGAAGVCADPYYGAAFTYTSPFTVVVTEDRPPHGSSKYGKFKVQVVSNQAAELTEGVEYLAFRVRIDHTRTVGTNACSGCCRNVQLILEHMTITLDPDKPRPVLYGYPYISWQGNSSCLPTPTTPLTMGQLRSLYR